jgi:hypothetical protein
LVITVRKEVFVHISVSTRVNGAVFRDMRETLGGTSCYRTPGFVKRPFPGLSR